MISKRTTATLVSYLCAGCTKKTLVMPFLLDSQVVYLCRECVNKEFDVYPEYDIRRSLPFCVICDIHQNDTYAYEFNKQIKKWQLKDYKDFQWKVLFECDNFGEFIFNALQKNTLLTIFQDKKKKTYYTVFAKKV